MDLVGLIVLRSGREGLPLRTAADLAEGRERGVVVVIRRAWISSLGIALGNLDRDAVVQETDMYQRRCIQAAVESHCGRLKYSVVSVTRPVPIRGLLAASREGCSVVVVQGRELPLIGQVWRVFAWRLGLQLKFVASGAKVSVSPIQEGVLKV